MLTKIFKTDNECYSPNSHHFSWNGTLCQLRIFPFMSKVKSLWEEMCLILKIFSRCYCLWARIKLDCVPSYPFPPIISTNWVIFIPFLLLEGKKQTQAHTKAKQKATQPSKKHKPEIFWMVSSLYIFVTPHFFCKAYLSRDPASSSQIHFCSKGFPYAHTLF